MNWAFFILRFVLAAGVVSLLFFSQRFWHRAIWQASADFHSKALRVGARLLWLGMVFLVASAFVDSVRMGHRHLIPRGTFLSALVGLWFFSALFAFLAVKLVRGIELLWSRFARIPRRNRQSRDARLRRWWWDQILRPASNKCRTRDGAIFFAR